MILAGKPWLASGRCGSQHLLPNGQPGQCDPNGRANQVKFMKTMKNNFRMIFFYSRLGRVVQNGAGVAILLTIAIVLNVLTTGKPVQVN